MSESESYNSDEYDDTDDLENPQDFSFDSIDYNILNDNNKSDNDEQNIINIINTMISNSTNSNDLYEQLQQLLEIQPYKIIYNIFKFYNKELNENKNLLKNINQFDSSINIQLDEQYTNIIHYIKKNLNLLFNEKMERKIEDNNTLLHIHDSTIEFDIIPNIFLTAIYNCEFDIIKYMLEILKTSNVTYNFTPEIICYFKESEKYLQQKETIHKLIINVSVINDTSLSEFYNKSILSYSSVEKYFKSRKTFEQVAENIIILNKTTIIRDIIESVNVRLYKLILKRFSQFKIDLEANNINITFVIPTNTNNPNYYAMKFYYNYYTDNLENIPEFLNSVDKTILPKIIDIVDKKRNSAIYNILITEKNNRGYMLSAHQQKQQQQFFTNICTYYVTEENIFKLLDLQYYFFHPNKQTEYMSQPTEILANFSKIPGMYKYFADKYEFYGDKLPNHSWESSLKHKFPVFRFLINNEYPLNKSDLEAIRDSLVLRTIFYYNQLTQNQFNYNYKCLLKNYQNGVALETDNTFFKFLKIIDENILKIAKDNLDNIPRDDLDQYIDYQLFNMLDTHSYLLSKITSKIYELSKMNQ